MKRALLLPSLLLLPGLGLAEVAPVTTESLSQARAVRSRMLDASGAGRLESSSALGSRAMDGGGEEEAVVSGAYGPARRVGLAAPSYGASRRTEDGPPVPEAKGEAKRIPKEALYGGAAVLGGLQGWFSGGLLGAAGGAAGGLAAAWLFQKGDYGGAFGVTAGGILGSVLGGPLGAVVGSVLGGLVGHFLGKLFHKGD